MKTYLKTEVKSVAARIKFMKSCIRRPYVHMTWQQARDLKAMKQEATRLCTIIAHLRGRVHIKGMTLAEQEAIVLPLLAVLQSTEQEVKAA